MPFTSAVAAAVGFLRAARITQYPAAQIHRDTKSTVESRKHRIAVSGSSCAGRSGVNECVLLQCVSPLSRKHSEGDWHFFPFVKSPPPSNVFGVAVRVIGEARSACVVSSLALFAEETCFICGNGTPVAASISSSHLHVRVLVCIWSRPGKFTSMYKGVSVLVNRRENPKFACSLLSCVWGP